MEIGSFIELEFSKGNELFKGEKNIARLNSGRAAIWHAFRVLVCTAIWLPYYQCDTVRNFLYRKKARVKFYHIDASFRPIDLIPDADEAVLLVNYYGVMSHQRMKELASKYENVIIDNSQALFHPPIKGCMNVYSARKFVGVPDGAYVIGMNAEKYIDEYEQCHSSDTSLFLLKRIEYGCEGKSYQARLENEGRIDTEDIMKMSKLTRTILDGADYELLCKKRRKNFEYASELLGKKNRLDPLKYYSDDCVPMVYPFVLEDDDLLKKLLDKKHFQGHWWSYLLHEMAEDSFEYWISRYVIPITIDQRYGEKELEYITDIIG